MFYRSHGHSLPKPHQNNCESESLPYVNRKLRNHPDSSEHVICKISLQQITESAANRTDHSAIRIYFCTNSAQRKRCWIRTFNNSMLIVAPAFFENNNREAMTFSCPHDVFSYSTCHAKRRRHFTQFSYGIVWKLDRNLQCGKEVKKEYRRIIVPMSRCFTGFLRAVRGGLHEKCGRERNIIMPYPQSRIHGLVT